MTKSILINEIYIVLHTCSRADYSWPRLGAMRASLDRSGQDQPIIVFQTTEHERDILGLLHYVLAPSQGLCRLIAARHLNWTYINCLVVNRYDPEYRHLAQEANLIPSEPAKLPAS